MLSSFKVLATWVSKVSGLINDDVVTRLSEPKKSESVLTLSRGTVVGLVTG
jgi:hypothetical protein